MMNTSSLQMRRGQDEIFVTVSTVTVRERERERGSSSIYDLQCVPEYIENPRLWGKALETFF